MYTPKLRARLSAGPQEGPGRLNSAKANMRPAAPEPTHRQDGGGWRGEGGRGLMFHGRNRHGTWGCVGCLDLVHGERSESRSLAGSRKELRYRILQALGGLCQKSD